VNNYYAGKLATVSDYQWGDNDVVLSNGSCRRHLVRL